MDNEKLVLSGHPGYEPCAKFDPIVSYANSVFRHYYVPHQQLSVDESFTVTKNHTSLMQYLSSKHHHHWGITLWMLCDSVSKYCLALYVYYGGQSPGDKN